MATCERIFRHLIRASFGVYHSYFPLVARQLCSKIDGNGPPNNIPDNLFEIQDVPFEKQWEENPEFDYTSLVSIPSLYDFVSSYELFQLNELYKLLKQENILDLVFMKLPVNHISEVMVIGSGVSKTHVRSTATLVYKILKYKRRNSSMELPRIEGLDGSCEWIAINMGNILLHLFLPSVRAHYDLEALWAAGPEFDEITHGVVCPSLNTTDESALGSIDWDQLVREVQQKKVQQTVCEDSHLNNAS
ncbi:Mitochondrial assembly of ribosomal large subunit protein 1 [Paragonimus heterotremus]|uniref:Mitochondrial assembly of ribosomal large subunit protein 1 n=1 Tax=Paragonimus heterotremus TaxID=100268 RepID=A0A8J4SL56_9TREM|nr:Mitochondrial assembly of ribosomal large subunit protein 1 [Paragonimus heterotremus]